MAIFFSVLPPNIEFDLSLGGENTEFDLPLGENKGLGISLGESAVFALGLEGLKIEFDRSLDGGSGLDTDLNIDGEGGIISRGTIGLRVEALAALGIAFSKSSLFALEGLSSSSNSAYIGC